MVARWAHNPKVVGSNPAPATKIQSLDSRFFYHQFLSPVHAIKSRTTGVDDNFSPSYRYKWTFMGEDNLEFVDALDQTNTSFLLFLVKIENTFLKTDL